MPELPEVEITHRSLAAILPAQIKNIIIHNPKLRFPVSSTQLQTLEGQVLQKGYRRAKYIVLPVLSPGQSLIPSDPHVLVIHLGMSGRISIAPKKQKVPKYTCIEFQLVGSKKFLYQDVRRFGCVLSGKSSSIRPLQNLGMEPLSDKFQITELFHKIHHSRRSIKNIIMDQSLIAGVGNIYANDSLFLAAIHPQIQGRHLNKQRISTLMNSIRQVLHQAIANEGSSMADFLKTDGTKGSYQNQFLVYQRAGYPCKICETVIEATKQQGRSSFFCPKCQF